MANRPRYVYCMYSTRKGSKRFSNVKKSMICVSCSLSLIHKISLVYSLSLSLAYTLKATYIRIELIILLYTSFCHLSGTALSLSHVLHNFFQKNILISGDIRLGYYSHKCHWYYKSSTNENESVDKNTWVCFYLPADCIYKTPWMAQHYFLCFSRFSKISNWSLKIARVRVSSYCLLYMKWTILCV